MKNKERLGSIPKGLSWIQNEEQKTIEQEPIFEISTSEQGLIEGWTRATFIITKDHLEKVKDLAWWERVTIKEVMHDALKHYLARKDVNPRKKSELSE